MKLRRITSAALLTLAFAAFTVAQDSDETILVPEEQNQIEVSTRINEFGIVRQADRMRRLDTYLIELKNNPGARGYIVFYQGKDALPSQYDVRGEDIYRDHLRAKNFDDSRIVFLNGFRAQQSTEFWIVPADENAPQLSNTIAAPTASDKESFLYHRSRFELAADVFLLPSVLEQRQAELDEFNRDNGDTSYLQEDSGEINLEEKSPAAVNFETFQRSWTSFNAKLKENADARGVVIFYADDKQVDVNKIRADVETRVKLHANEAGVAPERFQVSFGGYRNGLEIEMWINPKAAKSPEARPGKRSSVIE